MKEKYYFVSAPFEENPSGDRDYIEVLVRAINETASTDGTGVNAVYLTGENCDYDPHVESLDNLCQSRSRSSNFDKELRSARQDPQRRENVEKILRKILAETPPGSRPVLMLQLRPPETGAMLMPEDLDEFKSHNIKICITCHEYKLNYEGRRFLQAYAQEYFYKADKVIFFNEKDRNNAHAHATHSSFLSEGESRGITKEGHEKILRMLENKGQGYEFSHPPFDLQSKSVLSRVPPTTSYVQPTLEEFIERPPNIIVFGLLRNGKGFDIALDLADHLCREQRKAQLVGQEFLPNTKVMIVGKPSDCGLVCEILNRCSGGIIKILEEEKEQSLSRSSDEIRDIVTNDTRYMQDIEREVSRVVDERKVAYPRFKDSEEFRSRTKRQVIDKIIKGIIDTPRDNMDGLSAEIQMALKKRDTEYQTIQTKIENINYNPVDSRQVESDIQQSKLPEKVLSTNDYPLEVYFDVPSERMPLIFQQAKYAVKIDEKGWANNASGHISALANGCILITSWGMDTPDEVLPARTKSMAGASKDTHEGEYCGAIVLPEHKYSLGEGEHHFPYEKKTHYNSSQSGSAHKQFITPETIFAIIATREDSPPENKRTFEQAQKLMEQFEPRKVAIALIENISGESLVDRSYVVDASKVLLGPLAAADTPATFSTNVIVPNIRDMPPIRAATGEENLLSSDELGDIHPGSTPSRHSDKEPLLSDKKKKDGCCVLL